MNGVLFITHQTERYTYLQSVKLALEGGCRQIQLRMKDMPVDKVEAVAREAKKLCDAYGADLYIDDHVEVCLRVGARGVHLGQHDMPVAEARAILGGSFIIGGTANTFDDICRLRDAGADYVGLGPFRFTETKKNLSPVLGIEGYRHIIGQCKNSGVDLPIIAIGGIRFKDISLLIQAGASGVALSSVILRAFNPVVATKQIIKSYNHHMALQIAHEMLHGKNK